MSDDHNRVWSNIEEEKTKLSGRHKRISPKIINELTEEKNNNNNLRIYISNGHDMK
jgi:beta-mannanase